EQPSGRGAALALHQKSGQVLGSPQRETALSAIPGEQECAFETMFGTRGISGRSMGGNQPFDPPAFALVERLAAPRDVVASLGETSHGLRGVAAAAIGLGEPAQKRRLPIHVSRALERAALALQHVDAGLEATGLDFAP